ncbi:MAG: hypothetical protein GX444_08150 [Myxococcales bacterium]|nr:hypothetical protein [Myxococcales bacterium]
MKKRLTVVLLTLIGTLFIQPGSPVGAEKALTRIYIANLADPPQTIAAYCTAGEPTVVRPGATASCRTALPALFRLGFAGSSQTVLDVTQEGNFAVQIRTCSGTVTVQGARESLPQLLPNQTDYFVYVWKMGESR